MMNVSVWEGGITLAKVQIKVNDNGSFRITGDVELIDSQGNAFPAKPAFSLCRCGLSKICLIVMLHIKENLSLSFEHQRNNNTRSMQNDLRMLLINILYKNLETHKKCLLYNSLLNIITPFVPHVYVLIEPIQT